MSATHLAVMLRPLGLGDFLTGIPAYRAIARAFADHRIVLAAPAALAPLADLVGDIATLHPTLALAPLDAALCDADIAFDLHGRGPASQRILLAARPRRLVAFRNPAVSETATGAQWRGDEHEVGRWCRLLDHAGIPADTRDLDILGPPEFERYRGRVGTLIHAFAASEARRWPLDRWAAVARAERLAGRTVTLTGSGSERQAALELADRAGLTHARVFAGRTGLRELAGLVAAADRVVSGDTGVAHLATALRIPSLLLFGPMSPALWGPPAERTAHRVLWAGQSGDPHGSEVDRGLLAISVADVRTALEALTSRYEVA